MCNKNIKGGIMLAPRTLGPPGISRAGPKKQRRRYRSRSRPPDPPPD